MNSTIVALATPPLKSALAIIRVSGDEAFSYTSEIFSKPLKDIKKHALEQFKELDKFLKTSRVIKRRTTSTGFRNPCCGTNSH